MAGPLPDARAAPRIRAALETEPKWRDRSADDPLQETTKLKDIGNPYCYSNSHTVNIFINNACFLVKGTQCAGVVLVNNLINRAFCRLASLCRQSRRSTAARFPLNCGREDTFDLPEGVDPRSATTGGYICAGVPERRCHRNLCAEGSGRSIIPDLQVTARSQDFNSRLSVKVMGGYRSLEACGRTCPRLRISLQCARRADQFTSAASVAGRDMTQTWSSI